MRQRVSLPALSAYPRSVTEGIAVLVGSVAVVLMLTWGVVLVAAVSLAASPAAVAGRSPDPPYDYAVAVAAVAATGFGITGLTTGAALVRKDVAMVRARRLALIPAAIGIAAMLLVGLPSRAASPLLVLGTAALAAAVALLAAWTGSTLGARRALPESAPVPQWVGQLVEPPDRPVRRS
jgi:hypothetical protein